MKVIVDSQWSWAEHKIWRELVLAGVEHGDNYWSVGFSSWREVWEPKTECHSRRWVCYHREPHVSESSTASTLHDATTHLLQAARATVLSGVFLHHQPKYRLDSSIDDWGSLSAPSLFWLLVFWPESICCIVSHGPCVPPSLSDTQISSISKLSPFPLTSVCSRQCVLLTS